MSLFHPTDLNRQFIARPDTAKEDILYKRPDMTIRKLWCQRAAGQRTSQSPRD